MKDSYYYIFKSETYYAYSKQLIHKKPKRYKYKFNEVLPLGAKYN